MFLIAIFDNILVNNSDNFLSLQKVLLEIHHEIQPKAEIKRNMEMVSKHLHVTAAWVEEKVNLQKVKDAQIFFQMGNRDRANLRFFYFVATVKPRRSSNSII